MLRLLDLDGQSVTAAAAALAGKTRQQECGVAAQEKNRMAMPSLHPLTARKPGLGEITERGDKLSPRGFLTTQDQENIPPAKESTVVCAKERPKTDIRRSTPPRPACGRVALARKMTPRPSSGSQLNTGEAPASTPRGIARLHAFKSTLSILQAAAERSVTTPVPPLPAASTLSRTRLCQTKALPFR